VRPAAVAAALEEILNLQPAFAIVVPAGSVSHLLKALVSEVAEEWVVGVALRIQQLVTLVLDFLQAVLKTRCAFERVGSSQ
jgi:hypothetical protein